MADEAYRAVFLRVHPTGKMVLSLTTEPDGNEGRVRAARGRGARRPGARRQGRARRREPLRHRPRLQHEPVGRHARRRSRARPARSAPRRSCSRASRSRRRARRPAVGQRRVRRRRRRAAQTIADVALYAHGTGALPPGVEGGLDAQTVYARLTAHGARHLHPRTRRRDAHRPHRQGRRGGEGRPRPVIEVNSLEATLELGDGAASALTADARSLGSATAAAACRARRRGEGEHRADDRRRGPQGRHDRVPLDRVEAGDGGLSVHGDLDLLGATRPVAFDLAVGDDGHLTGSAASSRATGASSRTRRCSGRSRSPTRSRSSIDATLSARMRPRKAAPWLSSTIPSRPASRPTTTGRRSSTSTA